MVSCAKTKRWPASVSQAKILMPENSIFKKELTIGTEYLKIER
jgi:hypothetical protein